MDEKFVAFSFSVCALAWCILYHPVASALIAAALVVYLVSINIENVATATTTEVTRLRRGGLDNAHNCSSSRSWKDKFSSPIVTNQVPTMVNLFEGYASA
uniref:Secreted protein n=1 Tax=Ascaris lumbricoides TaxID=6252 RepID=A0A0M3HTD6_ASCLU